MKRKATLLLAMLLSTMSLVGCGENQIPDLSQEQMYRVEEYAAQLLLKYNKFYNDGTITEEEIAKQEDILDQIARNKAVIEQQKQNQHTNEPVDNQDAGGDDTNVTVVEPVYQDIDEFLGLTDFDISVDGYLICDRYPVDVAENDWQGMASATNGNKLVVINLRATNKTDEVKRLDMASMDVRASAVFNNTIRKAPLTTLLLNDFLMYRADIEAGANADLVIVVEVSEADAQAISAGCLVIKYNGAKMETSIM